MIDSSQPIGCTGYEDLVRMRDLLVAGRKSSSGGYYIHPGDLNWWLFYTYPDDELWEHIHLWESPVLHSSLEGWALLNPHWGTFDVFVHPSVRGRQRAIEMYIWAEECAAAIAASRGDNKISTIWVPADDNVLVKHLTDRGFTRDQHDHINMTRELDEDLLQVSLPDGFQVKDMHKGIDVAQRAAASYAAFQSSSAWERYLERYRRFRASPVYNPEHDLIVLAPDGRVASFCLLWLDDTNRVGLFEPVGTHPDFQRLGMGKAVMVEGLRRMKEAGMRTVSVLTGHDNTRALNLYRSLGFKMELKLSAYIKMLDIEPDKGQRHGG